MEKDKSNFDLENASLTVNEDNEDEKDHSDKRESWNSTMDFFLACIGFSVGLGNVWRFPYLCYKNGGGAFLIPYFLSVIIGGFPIYYLELSVGQFMNQGGPRAWSIVPLFQGIGVASGIIAFFLNCYYNLILAWALYYIFSSFTSELPWVKCGHDWNTPNCSHDYFVTAANGSDEEIVRNVTDPVTEFWENKVLQISDGLGELGSVKWDIALCLLLAWLIVYGCICKGIKTSGKVMYFTATAPYVFMFILLIKNCTLDGSSDGIAFYLKPNMTKLTELSVWADAGTQIFFSWGIGFGILTVLGSYNKFKRNSLRDAVAFSTVNAGTSLLAGFIVFSILGFMAKQQGVLVSDVAESGPGLAFIAYPKAVAQLPLSPMWSILFFSMIILLGLDSQFVGVESVVTAVVDQYPHLLRKGYRKEIFIGLLCISMFLIGLLMVTEGGMYVFQMFDYYTGSRVILLVALAELVALSYCYGVRRFTDNVVMMTGESWTRHILPYLQISWTVLSPAFCIILFVLSVYNYSELTYKRPNHPKYTYPQWGVALGWTMAAISFIWIPIVAIYKVIRLVWMGGRLSDLHLLIVPYSLQEHQRRPEDNKERCLADFETEYRQDCRAMNHDLSIIRDSNPMI